MLNREKLIQSISSLPEEFSIDELIERLIFLEKIERGNSQSQNKEVVSEKLLNAETIKWFE